MAPNGYPVKIQKNGTAFLLSTVLAVTRNRGTTLQEAMDQIESSVKADFTNPKGTFYFSKTKNVRSKTSPLLGDVRRPPRTSGT